MNEHKTLESFLSMASAGDSREAGDSIDNKENLQMDLREDINIMSYRRQQLEKELDLIRNVVSGRDENFLQVISDEKGKVDSERLETLIDRIIESYKFYLEDEDRYKPDEEKRVIDEEVRQLLHHFLYLAILAPGLYIDYFFITAEYYSISSTYGDIIKSGEGLKYYKSLEDLYWDEAYFAHYCDGEMLDPSFTEMLNNIYSRFSKKRIEDTYKLSHEEWDPNNVWVNENYLADNDTAESATAEDKKGENDTAESETAEDKKGDKDTSESEAAEDKKGDKDIAESGKAENDINESGKAGRTETEVGTFDYTLITPSKIMTVEEAKALGYYDDEYESEEGNEYEEAIELPPKTLEDYQREEEEFLERANAIFEESEETFHKWRAILPDEEEFCRIYLEFRDMYFPDADTGETAGDAVKDFSSEDTAEVIAGNIEVEENVGDKVEVKPVDETVGDTNEDIGKDISIEETARDTTEEIGKDISIKETAEVITRDDAKDKAVEEAPETSREDKDWFRWFAMNLNKEIGNMIDSYLFRYNISPYSLGRSYGLVSDRIKNTSVHLRAELARARRLDK